LIVASIAKIAIEAPDDRLPLVTRPL